jgi:recombinase-like zinc beta ribbon protein
MLLDPDDVAAGHVVRFRRAGAERVVRSRRPAHPAIVSVEDFTQVQLLRRSKGADGLTTARKTERAGRSTKRTYLFGGLIRCGVCTRKMEASPRAHGMYYRCPARTLAPGSSALAEHPPSVYLREDLIRDTVNAWIGELFSPEQVDETVTALVGAQERPSGEPSAAKKRMADAEARLRRFQAAIGAGIDPAALVEVINTAQAERAAARAELDNAPAPSAVTEADVYAMIDSLGDVSAVIKDGSTERLANVYATTDLQVCYEPETSTAEVSIRVNSARVRGRSCTLTTRIVLA